ncbi:MAG: glycosyltransferase family 2 protein [Romboutsia sp.]
MGKVSVIVPVYNAEKVLARCVESILKQSYKNLELILINDGSKDKSIDIMRKYEKIDNRIKIIDNENNGVSETRNIGVRESSGEYIQFVDSDDYIELDMIEKTMDFVEKENIDLVMSGLFLDIEGNNGIETAIQTFEIAKCTDKINIASNVLSRLNGTYINSPVNKLYKKSIITDNNIVMDKNIDLGEDLIFNLEYLSFCNSVIFLEESYYHYCMQVEDNLTFKYREDKLELMEILYKKCKVYFEESNLDESKIKSLNGLFIKWMYSCFIDLNNRNCPLKFREKYNYIKLNIKKYKKITDEAYEMSSSLSILKLTFLCPSIVLMVSKLIYLIKVNFRKVLYK